MQCMVRRLTAREKLRDEKSASMYPAFEWRRSPGHDEIRRVPFLINSSAMEGHLHQQVSGPPFDCSFILTIPLQTSVGNL